MKLRSLKYIKTTMLVLIWCIHYVVVNVVTPMESVIHKWPQLNLSHNPTIHDRLSDDTSIQLDSQTPLIVQTTTHHILFFIKKPTPTLVKESIRWLPAGTVTPAVKGDHLVVGCEVLVRGGEVRGHRAYKYVAAITGGAPCPIASSTLKLINFPCLRAIDCH